MSSNLTLVRRSRRLSRGGRKLEVNIPPQQIHANSKRGLINEGGVMSSEYVTKISKNIQETVTALKQKTAYFH